MVTAIRVRNQSQQLYVRAISTAWKHRRVHDPSLWLLKDPEMMEKMLRDADIAHALNYRRELIAGRQWNIVPKRQTPRADMSVFVATELLREIKHFTAARENLASAFFSGGRVARIYGDTRTLSIGDGKPRTWWVPTTLEDLDKRMFQKISEIDPHTHKITAHWEEWNVGKSDWEDLDAANALQLIRHTYQDDQATMGYGRGLREALGWWWYAKEHVFQESLQAVERFAQGIIHARIDSLRDADTGLPNDQLVKDWQDVLEDQRARHTLVSDKGDVVEMIEGSAVGWEMMESMRGELRNTITTLILGSTLPTTASEGGSYALANIQENSTEALIQFDRESLEETLTDDLLGCVWFKNHPNLVELGVAEEKPRFSITQQKRQDPKERAEVAQVLNTMGVKLSADDLYGQTGFRKPEDGEEIVEGAAAQPVMPGVGGFGFKGGAPERLPGETEQQMFKRLNAAADRELVLGGQLLHAAGGRPEGGE